MSKRGGRTLKIEVFCPFTNEYLEYKKDKLGRKKVKNMNDNLRNEKTSLRKYFEYLKTEGMESLHESYLLNESCYSDFIKFSNIFVNDQGLKNKTKIITIYTLINFFNWFNTKKVTPENEVSKGTLKKIVEECENIKEQLNKLLDESQTDGKRKNFNINTFATFVNDYFNFKKEDFNTKKVKNMSDNLRNERCLIKKYLEYVSKEDNLEVMNHKYFENRGCIFTFQKFSNIIVYDKKLKKPSKINFFYALIKFFKWSLTNYQDLAVSDLAKENVKAILTECENSKNRINTLKESDLSLYPPIQNTFNYNSSSTSSNNTNNSNNNNNINNTNTNMDTTNLNNLNNYNLNAINSYNMMMGNDPLVGSNINLLLNDSYHHLNNQNILNMDDYSISPINDPIDYSMLMNEPKNDLIEKSNFNMKDLFNNPTSFTSNILVNPKPQTTDSFVSSTSSNSIPGIFNNENTMQSSKINRVAIISKINAPPHPNKKRSSDSINELLSGNTVTEKKSKGDEQNNTN